MLSLRGWCSERLELQTQDPDDAALAQARSERQLVAQDVSKALLAAG
jgi:hypothetical protein